MISRDIQSLKQTGELLLVDSVRGDGKGINLYLPADLDAEDYLPPAALTWLEEVARSFNDFWDERAAQAIAEGRKPRPPFTGEIRAWSRVTTLYPENFADPVIFINALQQLARTTDAVTRKIKRTGQRAVLWAPARVEDTDLDMDDVYASDIERISHAVRRAENDLGRPVTFRDVRDQVELDPSLRPIGSSSLFSVLSDAARENIISNDDEPRSGHATQHVYRVGKIADVAYYATNVTPAAEAFVEFGRLELLWSAMRVGEQLGTLATCLLPTVAMGRVLLVAMEAADVKREIDRLCVGGHLVGEQRQKADELRQRVITTIGATRDWFDKHAIQDFRLPKDVITDVPGWTADELLEVVKPLYPRSRKLLKGTKLLQLVGDAIRRVQNPQFVNRFSSEQLLASEYLFDRTDALIYVAKKWGGHECCLQATLAGNELGHLRDTRFVMAGMASQDFSARLSAVACLAFLPTESGNACLRDMAINDVDPGVRQSALWAYGFAGGVNARELLEDRAKNDEDSRVRDMAYQVLVNSENSWWTM